MVIANNMISENIKRHMIQISKGFEKSLTRLSSGYQINRAADNAASLCISEKMRSQIRGLNQASQNSQDGISLLQTAEGGAFEIHSLLQRMRELSVQAANDTNTPEDRQEIQEEIRQLTKEVDRIADTTEFNTLKLLDGSLYSSKIGGGGSGSAGTVYKQKISWTGSQFTLLNGHGMQISYFDGSSNQNLNLIMSDSWTPSQTKDGIYPAPGVNGTLIDYVNFYNATILAPNGKGGKLEHFLNRFEMSTDTKDDHILIFTAKDPAFKINSISCVLGSAISNSGVLEVSSSASGTGLMLQIGAKEEEALQLSIDSLTANALKLGSASVLSHSSASVSIRLFDSAIEKVSQTRSAFGAYQNRLMHAITNLDNTSENTASAESRIRDTDMAKEMIAYAKNHILLQSSQAFLSQGNQNPKQILSLFQ